MTKRFFHLLLFLSLASVLPATEVLFISNKGNDAWSGNFADPLPDGSDGPLASLAEARQRVRDRLADPTRPREEILVNLRAGEYPLGSGLVLGEADSGIGPAPVTWQAYPGEQVVLSGGKRIEGFQRLADAGIPNRIRESARPQVWVVHLPSLGIEFNPALQRRDFYRLEEPGPVELYYNNRLMTLARYPDEDWLQVADVPQLQGEPLNPGHHEDKRDGKVPTGRHYGWITYPGDRPSTWASTNDVWLHGFWTWDWADSTQGIDELDTGNHRILLAPPHHRYGYTSGQRFRFINVPEELDSPGEWYLDRKSGYLYFWPPEGDLSGEVRISQCPETMLQIDGAEWLNIRGLNFAWSRGPAIQVTDSREVLIDDCRFFDLGGRAITVEGGAHCGVTNCEFTQLAVGAVDLDGGDRKTLVPGRHYVINNHIHAFSQVYRTNQPAIRLLGVGQHASRNHIHNAPHMGLYFRGNDHLIEYNEIHDIALETGDVGAIYVGRDYTSRGTIVRYNYLHHLHGPGLHGVRGVYLDDFSSGIVVFGNLFYKAGRAAFIGGGRNNRIQNNIFIECAPSVQIDGRGLSWAVHHFDESHPRYASTLRDFYAAANVTEPPYSIRYPELQYLYQDEPRVPKGNVVENNISFGGIFLDLYDGVDLELATVRNNLIGDPVALRMSETSDQDPRFTVYRIGEPDTAELLRDNILWKDPDLPFRVEGDRILLDLDAIPAEAGFLPVQVDEVESSVEDR